MKGIDTNVLVRYIVQDDPAQAAAATRLLETELSPETPGRICLIVMCELVWVLERAYGYDKASIAGVLRNLLQATELEVESSGAACKALRDYETGPADFSDYVVAHLNMEAGATQTFTFDRKAAKHRGFRLIAG